jgi:hypothetical protein
MQLDRNLVCIATYNDLMPNSQSEYCEKSIVIQSVSLVIFSLFRISALMLTVIADTEKTGTKLRANTALRDIRCE